MGSRPERKLLRWEWRLPPRASQMFSRCRFRLLFSLADLGELLLANVALELLNDPLVLANVLEFVAAER